MAQFPLKNGLIQGTLAGTPTSGTLDLSSLTLTVPVSALRIGTSVQAYDADLTTWAGVTPAAGITTFLATPSGANLATALTSALPASKGGTGLTALGTGIATALGINTGSAGAPILFNGALGTPTSGTLTNATGLPVSTGISGLGTGVAAALAVATNAAGGFSPINGTSTLTNKTISGASNTITNVSLTTGVTGTLPVANGGTGVTALPKFAAYMGSNQSIATATMVKVNFDTEFFDTNSNYDNATNYRFTPTVAGKYMVGGHVYWASTSGAAGVSVFIRKNGSDYARLDQKTGTSTITIMGGSTLVDMNGSSDYLEFFVYQDSGTSKDITAGSSITQFWASMIP